MFLTKYEHILIYFWITIDKCVLVRYKRNLIIAFVD
jgi:hypothetical protein